MSAYRAKWGKTLMWVSALATVLIAGFSAAMPEFWLKILLLAMPVGALPFVVRGYAVRNGTLFIRRLWWETQIELTGLRSVRFDPEALKGSIKTCGNGGLFSFTGWYWSRQLKTYRMYVTDLKRPVVLVFDTRRIVVSPDEPERFVAELTAFATGRSVI
jgi:hypothetical protein